MTIMIYDCPTIQVRGLPEGMAAHVDADGEIVIWDGRSQHHTGAKKEGPELRRALKHHWATVWVGKKAAD